MTKERVIDMNEIIKAMLDRRSIRKYEDKPVPENLIHDIVEAGLYAASSMGRQNTKMKNSVTIYQNSIIRLVAGLPAMTRFMTHLSSSLCLVKKEKAKRSTMAALS